MTYKFLEHTGDVKFRVESNSLEEMFISAADALLETIYGNIRVHSKKELEFKVNGSDIEELLYNFLEEFLFLLDSKNLLIAKIKSLRISKNSLICVVLGDDAEDYKFVNNVKAVTYSDMFVRHERKKFICEVVLDV